MPFAFRQLKKISWRAKISGNWPSQREGRLLWLREKEGKTLKKTDLLYFFWSAAIVLCVILALAALMVVCLS